MRSKRALYKYISFILAIVMLSSIVLSSCGKATTDASVGAGDVITDENGNIISSEGEATGASDDEGADGLGGFGGSGNSYLARPIFDWRRNVYQEYALDFGLNAYEPFHIFDIDTNDGRVLAVAKINATAVDDFSIEEQELKYRLVIADNAKPGEFEILSVPEIIEQYAEGAAADASVLEAGYSGLKLCYDGSVLGVYSGTTCNIGEDGIPKLSYVRYLTHWDEKGNVLWNTDISEYLVYEYGFVKYVALLADGRTAVFTECDKTYGLVISKEGKIENSRTIGEDDGLFYVSDIVATEKGDIVFYSKRYTLSDSDEDSLYEELHVDSGYFDADSLEISEGVIIPYEVRKNDYYAINKGYDSDFVYSNEIGVFSFSIGDEKSEKIMDYVNSDFRGYYFTDICVVDNSSVIGVFANFDEGIETASGFAYVDPSGLSETNTIELGVYGIDNDLRRLVREYNNKSDKYRVVIADYSELALEDIDLSKAVDICKKDDSDEKAIDISESDYMNYVRSLQLEQLRNDLLSGVGPDLLMIDPSMLDYYELAEAGLLVTFEELAGSDIEISGGKADNLQQAYLMNVMDAYAISGKHYLYIYDFYYNIYAGRKESTVLPTLDTGWSIIDFDLTYSSYHVGGSSLMTYNLTNAPVMIAYRTRTQFIDVMLKYDGYEFVDIEGKTCDFESEDFISLLKYAGSLAAKNDDSLKVYKDISASYRNDSVLLTELVLGDGTPEEFWSDVCRNYDGNYNCIGFPSRSGDASVSGVITIAQLPIAITSIGNIEGSWDFARLFFCEEYQNSVVENGNGIPVLKDSLNDWFSRGMSRSAGLYYSDEEGNSIFSPNTYVAEGNYAVTSYMMEDDIECLMNSLTTCNKREFTDSAVIAIVKEETDDYFAGNINVEDTAHNIQERVLEYLAK